MSLVGGVVAPVSQKSVSRRGRVKKMAVLMATGVFTNVLVVAVFIIKIYQCE